MEHIKKIIVSMQFEEAEIELGELVNDKKNIYFKYYPSFIKRGLEISPIKLRLNNEINQANETPFEGLFGDFLSIKIFKAGILKVQMLFTSKQLSKKAIK